MAFVHTLTRGYRDSSGNTLSSTESPSGDNEVNLSYPTAAGATNAHLVLAFKFATMLSLCINSVTGCTIKTNSSSSPSDTITVTPGQNLIWSNATDGGSKNPFQHDVTDLYITNTSGSVIDLLNIRILSSI